LPTPGSGRPMEIGRMRGAACVLLVALMAGCGSTQEKADEVRREVLSATDKARVGPQSAPVKTFTSFTPALRCMDNLMINYGVKGVNALVEDLQDATKKVNAGTRDMLISAVSEMTRRSGAIRLVAYGADSANVIGFLKEAERKSAYQNLPEYGVRGSISQLDDNVAKKQDNIGVQIGPVGGGRNVQGSAQILAVDLSMIRTEDISVLPGVSSRNSVVIMKEGQGVDVGISGSWHSQALGINFDRSMDRNEGMAQALRNLIELASIELFGRLLKIPYWTCLGADSTNEAVATEITDWYYSLYSNQASLITYFQWQLKVRSLYDGEINGEPDEELRDAVTAYRRALGLPASARIDQEFFTAYLNANHGQATAAARQYLASVPQRPRPVAPAQPMQQPAPQAAAAQATREAPLDLTMTSNSQNWLFLGGEEIRLSVGVSRDAYLYCWSQDETGAVSRFFPNRFATGAMVAGGRALQIPGSMPFKLLANRKGQKERILCVAAARDVLGNMPSRVVGTDFDRLPVQSLDEVMKAFEGVGDTAVAMKAVDVLVR
jgi:hypothetical protein